MRKYSIAQILAGTLLGGIVVIAAVTGFAYLYSYRLAQKPPKPDFAAVEEAQKDQAGELAASTQAEEEEESDGSYVALVTYADGLILRKEPDSTAEAIDTLEVETTVRVLEKSEDEQWERLRVEETGEEGWVAIGNTQRAN
jgi:hypothetical protein